MCTRCKALWARLKDYKDTVAMLRDSLKFLRETVEDIEQAAERTHAVEIGILNLQHQIEVDKLQSVIKCQQEAITEIKKIRAEG